MLNKQSIEKPGEILFPGNLRELEVIQNKPYLRVRLNDFHMFRPFKSVKQFIMPADK